MEVALSQFRQNAVGLKLSNSDLRNFAYTASHDLRSPLRAISGLVDRTIEDAAKELKPETRQNLELIQGRVNRLSDMLRGLLNHARAGGEKAKAVRMDLPRYASEHQDLLAPRGHFEVIARGLPEFEGPATPLRS